MSDVYVGMRRVRGWMKPFIHHVANGDSDTRAASRVETSTHIIQQSYASDPTFKAEYDAAVVKRLKNPKYGRRSWM